MTFERPQMPNGTPPPAVTIHVLPTADAPGHSLQVSHALQGGWAAAVQVLLGALQIAIAQERKAREPEAQPPLIQLPNVRVDPRWRSDRG